MALAFNEEQRSLKQTARDFAQNKAPITEFRKLRGTGGDGFSRDVWAQMIELGWGGMTFPEAYGGFEFGYMGLAGCMEEFGRTLVASPLLSSVVLAGTAILHAGTEEQKQELLPAIASGEKLFALAVDEGPQHDPAMTAMSVMKNNGTYILTGQKTCVIDGASADMLVVAVRTSGKPGDAHGITLFLVDPKTPGILVERTTLVDSRNYARISFENLTVDASAMLGNIDEGFAALNRALDCGRVCLAAEMFGGMQEIFERTVQYLKERKQFGVLIGTFQGLQHRAAHMYTEIEMCKSILMLALDALETNSDNYCQLISAAKAKMNETYELISNEATQMHGGIGVTDELDIGLFLKRARTSANLLGSARFHHDRYATLEGF